ncbi:MAG: hypothetical protein AAF636_03615 [Pseudomonadota bacterium]
MQELPRQIRRYAVAMGLTPSGKLVADIAPAASFDSMKETAHTHLRETEAATKREQLFSIPVPPTSGSDASAKPSLPRTMRMAALATPTERAFLEEARPPA